MQDRCLFLADEVACAFVDDFLVLPADWIVGNIYRGLTESVLRHDLLFFLTH